MQKLCSSLLVYRLSSSKLLHINTGHCLSSRLYKNCSIPEPEPIKYRLSSQTRVSAYFWVSQSVSQRCYCVCTRSQIGVLKGEKSQKKEFTSIPEMGTGRSNRKVRRSDNAPGRLAATLCLHARRNERAFTLMMLHKLVLVAHGS